jgi:hypothetical protein
MTMSGRQRLGYLAQIKAVAPHLGRGACRALLELTTGQRLAWCLRRPLVPGQAGPIRAGVLAAVGEAVERANTAVSRAEAIKRFRIRPGGFAVGAELTPTQKVRRDYVLATFAADVEALYA